MTATAHKSEFFLCADDLVILTGKKQSGAQCSALRRMGVKFGTRLDGSPVVTRDAVRAYTGEGASSNDDRPTINLQAIHGSQAKAR